MKEERLSVIFAVFGRIEDMIGEYTQAIDALKPFAEQIELVLVCETDIWLSIPTTQVLGLYFPALKTIPLENKTSIPAALFNVGAEEAIGEYLTFLWPGCMAISEKLNAELEHLSYGKSEEGIFYISRPELSGIDENMLMTLLKNKNVLSPNDLLIQKKLFLCEKMSESPVLQRDFLRDFLVRMTGRAPFISIGMMEEKVSDLMNYPLSHINKYPQRFINQYILRECMNSVKQTDQQIELDLICDQPVEERTYWLEHLKMDGVGKPAMNKRPIKIVLAISRWGQHHARICFYNYLSRLNGSGFCSYCEYFEDDVQNEDLSGADLVILVRCNGNNVRNIMDYCEKEHIQTLYMLDDNWISLHKDWPEAAGGVSPGMPLYENFIEGVSRSSCVLVYSDLVAEDLAPYAKHIIQFGISVDEQLYAQYSSRKRRDDEIIIGYAGSMRQLNDYAFTALTNVAKKDRRVRLLHYGIMTDKQKRIYAGIPVISMGFVPYSLYVESFKKIGPDLIIAPLDNSRLSRSKCCNKYIESAIVGAAGLYSNVKPYVDEIVDGKNGFFVTYEDQKGWEDSLKGIMQDIPQLRRVQKSAYLDCMKRFTVGRKCTDFQRMIEKVVTGCEESD